MLTKNQTKLLGDLGDGQKHGAPHLSELAEALSDAFGGPASLAEMLRGLVDDPKAPDWLRMRAAGVVVNTISAASKLPDAQNVTDDLGMISDEDLHAKAIEIMREALDINEAMDAELAAVVSAWPELPEATRAGIVATVGSSISMGDAD